MAVLTAAGRIHGDVQGCLDYIRDPEKIVPNTATSNVLRYMQSHCVEDICSVGYNGCSGVREMALEQFRLAEAAYRKNHAARKPQETRITVEQYLASNHKKKLPRHIKPDADGMITIRKSEVSAEHLVISAHKEDRPSPALLQAVVNEFMQHPYLRGFPAVSNLHWNTDEKHAHLLICNYRADGSRKLSLSGTKFRELRRYLDRICYAHGLSIIDTREARLNPEHSEWLDKVIAEGKVKVWPGERRGQANWKAADNRSKAETIALQDKYWDVPAPVKATGKEIIRNSWFVADGEYLRMIRRAKLRDEELKQRFYHVSIKEYDRRKHRYRERSTLELIYCLARLAITSDTAFLARNYPSRAETLTASFGPPDRELQWMFDSIAAARELNCRSPVELEQRRQEIGMAMRETARAIKYDAAVIASGRQSEPERYERRLQENRAHMDALKRDYRRAVRAIKSLDNARVMVERYNSAALEAAKEPPERLPLSAIIRRAETRTDTTRATEKGKKGPALD